MKYAILDIDGCCLDINERLPYLLSGDYKTYMDLYRTDKPIKQGVHIYTMLMKDPNINCVFVTARNDGIREQTEEQLAMLFPGLDYALLMRPENCHELDAHIKLRLIKDYCGDYSNVFIAFDDRPAICEAYRNVGIVAYCTDEGY